MRECLHGACLSVERCLSALAFVRRTSYKMCVVHSRPSRSVHREPRVTLCCQCVPWACSHDLRIFLKNYRVKPSHVLHLYGMPKPAVYGTRPHALTLLIHIPITLLVLYPVCRPGQHRAARGRIDPTYRPIGLPHGLPAALWRVRRRQAIERANRYALEELPHGGLELA